MPPFGLFNRNWRNFLLLRFGFTIVKLPLLTRSQEYRFSGTLISFDNLFVSLNPSGLIHECSMKCQLMATQNKNSPGKMFRALRHPNFRLYIAGMAVSLAGTWMQQLAQSWLVYRLTGSEFMLGLVWFCSNIPVLLLSPLAGLAADRYPRRRIIFAAQAAAMLQAVLLAFLTLSGAVQTWHVIALALVFGVSNAFDIPTRQAFYIQLVGKDDLINAISLNSATFNAARVAGPALGGIIVARLGEGPCFALNAVSYLAVLASLAAMRLDESLEPSSDTPLERLRQGFAYAWHTPPLRGLLATCGLVALSIAPVMTLAPMFAGDIFQRGPDGLGLLTSAMGLGAIAGTLSLARRTASAGLPRVVFFSAATLSVTLTLFAISPRFNLSLALMPFIGMAIMRHNASTNTTIQLAIPDHLRGRVMAFYSMMVIGMFPIGSLLAGLLANHLGSRAAVFLGATGCAAAAAFVYRRQTQWTNWLTPTRTPH